VLRTFISKNGVEWTPDTVCVFDGLQSVLERCTAWYENRLSAEKAGELVREDARENSQLTPGLEIANAEEHIHDDVLSPEDSISLTALPDGIQMFTAEPITDRKSAFVGRACRISQPAEAGCLFRNLCTCFLTYELGSIDTIISHDRSTNISSSASNYQCMAMPSWQPSASG
jgi:hypothetical protein